MYGMACGCTMANDLGCGLTHEDEEAYQSPSRGNWEIGEAEALAESAEAELSWGWAVMTQRAGVQQLFVEWMSDIWMAQKGYDGCL